MGAADAVPGISGGTLALILGIYERLISALSRFNLNVIKQVFTGDFVKAWNTMDGTFLITLFIGMGLSLVSLLNLVHWLMLEQPILLWSFFFGLVLSSVFYLGKKLHWNKISTSLFAIGVLLSIFLGLTNANSIPLTPLSAFIGGAVAICAMILPGISGSFILILMGLYLPISEAVHNHNVTIIGIFLLGCMSGLLSFSKFLNWILGKYHNQTLALMTGVVAGATLKLWPWQNWAEQNLAREDKMLATNQWYLPWNFEAQTLVQPEWILAIMAAFIGGLLILILAKADARPEE